MSKHPAIAFSPLELERFGVRTARVDDVQSAQLDEVEQFCHDNTIQLLIARCSVTTLATAQAMQQRGHLLMDTVLSFTRKLENGVFTALSGKSLIREAQAEDTTAVVALAKETFRNFGGHYHADARLPRHLCDAVYESWAERSCLYREVADVVYVAEREREIVGFITVKRMGGNAASIQLYGVSPTAQGFGVGGDLVTAALQWAVRDKRDKMILVTQINNFASQRVCIRNGFEVTQASYTFHKWYD